ncbi:hypothetical protein NDU88_001764 [Pleurodeles waltl]|uniref:Uncharacterized protein n=1 Tax=Pleurodeles waltl TaxID=8319 RepID=A0AAV7MLF5_PLEWA|nr:hypothetical protein NDU88_001764 [Pleurodeles waltl]
MLVRELASLETDLHRVECAVTTDSSDLAALRTLRARHREVDERLRIYDYRHYISRSHAEGNRSGRLPTWLLRGEQHRVPIGALRLDTGIVVNTQLFINDAFRCYYSMLYVARPDPLATQLAEFFDSLHLVHLTLLQSMVVDGPIEIARSKQPCIN